MGNVKDDTVYKWISNYPELIYDKASRTIHCTKCESHLNIHHKNNIDRHIKGAVHQGTQKPPPNKDFNLTS